MRRFLIFIAVFCCWHGLQAQPLPDRRPLLGRIVDNGGKPLSGAVISIRRRDDVGSYAFWGATVASDARGEFRFARAETGNYYLNAELPGFAPIYNQSIVWTGGDMLRLQLQRLVTLGLKLSRPDGSPAVNTLVWLRLRGDGNAGQTTKRTSTDGDAQLQVDGLQAGIYSLFLTTPAGFGSQNDVTLTAPATVGDVTARDVTLQSGGTIKIVVREANSARLLGGAVLVLTPATIQEAARLAGNQAEMGDNIALLGAGGRRLALVSRDGDGQIEVPNLPPGQFMARLILNGYNASETKPVTITAGQTAALDWTLVPKNASATSLRLQLHESNGQNAASGEFGLRVLPIASNGTLATDAAADESNPYTLPNGNIARRALSDENGQITLFPLKVGRYRVFVTRSLTNQLDDEETEANPLDVDVPAGGATANLTLKDAP